MSTAIVWFRHDLRLLDHAALFYSAKENQYIIPLFIFDENIYGEAQRWWLYHSRTSLQIDLQKHKLKLILRRGNSEKVLKDFCKEAKVDSVYCNRSYETSFMQLESNIKTYPGNLLTEPEVIKNKEGTNR